MGALPCALSGLSLQGALFTSGGTLSDAKADTPTVCRGPSSPRAHRLRALLPPSHSGAVACALCFSSESCVYSLLLPSRWYHFRLALLPTSPRTWRIRSPTPPALSCPSMKGLTAQNCSPSCACPAKPTTSPGGSWRAPLFSCQRSEALTSCLSHSPKFSRVFALFVNSCAQCRPPPPSSICVYLSTS